MYVHCTLCIGEYSKALSVTSEVLKVAPTSVIALRNKIFYDNKLKELTNYYYDHPVVDEDKVRKTKLQTSLATKIISTTYITILYRKKPIRCFMTTYKEIGIHECVAKNWLRHRNNWLHCDAVMLLTSQTSSN